MLSIRCCSQLDWTTQLGDAFNADQAGVLASVQRLRAQAQQYGTLKTTQQQTVTTQTDNGKQVIVIQPANPQVVYVPQYNPQTVYVQQSSGPSTGDIVAASIISFGVGVAIGAMFSSNNYYYPRWGYGGVYYRGGPWYPAHYAYRPVYGPAFRPAYGYRPPAGYPYHRPAHYNNYYNGYRPGGGNYRPPANRPGGGYNRPPANGGGYNRPGTLPNNPGSNRPPGNGYNKPPTGGGNTRPPTNGGGYNRPGNPGNGTGTRPTTRPAVTPDRGYSRPATQPSTRPAQQRPAPQQRSATQQQRPQSRPAAPGFSGGGSGRSAQAASQRGAASRGGRGETMKTKRLPVCGRSRGGWVRLFAFSLLVFGLPVCGGGASRQGTEDVLKSSEAVAALVAAARTGDGTQLLAVLGPDGKDLIDSGDPVADKKGFQWFTKAYDTKHSIVVTAPGYKTLVVGANDWPMPVPLVRDGMSWYFDSAQGRDEIVNRRVGENELGAIAVCEGYYRAQKEYAAKRHDGMPAKLYAQKFSSDPGKQNGLYWPVAGWESHRVRWVPQLLKRRLRDMAAADLNPITGISTNGLWRRDQTLRGELKTISSMGSSLAGLLFLLIRQSTARAAL